MTLPLHPDRVPEIQFLDFPEPYRIALPFRAPDSHRTAALSVYLGLSETIVARALCDKNALVSESLGLIWSEGFSMDTFLSGQCPKPDPIELVERWVARGIVGADWLAPDFAEQFWGPAHGRLRDLDPRLLLAMAQDAEGVRTVNHLGAELFKAAMPWCRKPEGEPYARTRYRPRWRLTGTSALSAWSPWLPGETLHRIGRCVRALYEARPSRARGGLDVEWTRADPLGGNLGMTWKYQSGGGIRGVMVRLARAAWCWDELAKAPETVVWPETFEDQDEAQGAPYLRSVPPELVGKALRTTPNPFAPLVAIFRAGYGVASVSHARVVLLASRVL